MAEKLWKLKLHPEAPIKVSDDNIFEFDLLAFKDSVVKLSYLIEQIETPFTISICGDWGSGKTSFMKMLQKYLEKDKKFITFWFDSWEYENEASLLLPLLSKMAKKFIKHEASFKSLKKIVAGVLLTSSNALLKAATLDLVKLKDIKQNLELYENNVEKLYDSWVGEIERLKTDFKELIEKIRSDNLAVIIFIDDLDRCMPENVVRLIENIKHFLSVEGCKCIFIMGVDKEVLKKGIQARYGTDLISGKEYLEKIINLSFDVPQHDLSNKEFIIETAKKIAEPDWYKKISEEIKDFNNSFSKLGIDNPRKIKQLILRYLFFLSLPEHGKYIPQIVIRLVIYREIFPDAYIMMKEEGKVHYFPDYFEADFTGGHREMRELEYEEIERKYCKGFADIHKNYKSLEKVEHPLDLFISRGFHDVSNEVLENTIKEENFQPSHYKEILLDIFAKNYIRNHLEYFRLVDFLFSLS